MRGKILLTVVKRNDSKKSKAIPITGCGGL
jgi:hypothetical protein